MMLFPAATVFLWGLYALLILRYRAAWQQITPFQPSPGHRPSTRLSLVIAARNESATIPHCLRAIMAQDYPKALYEVIIVDDHSTDDTAALVRGFAPNGVRLVELSKLDPGRQGKKAALTEGIRAASSDLILVTDADCHMETRWMRTMASFYEHKQADFIAAPVRFETDSSPLGIFQQLDFLSLQGITAAAVSNGYHGLCNGANLAYRKSAFEAVGGFEGIDGIASGDDMLLMQKIARQPGMQIGYCLSSEAIVSTPGADSWRAFLQQRIRWASKARFYQERGLFFVLLLVWLLNAALLALTIAGILFSDAWARTAAWLLLGKTLVELTFLWPVAGFFSRRALLGGFLPAQPFHIVYTVLAGLLGQNGSYEWKGRRVR